eukprot:CAMPEP_0183463732 /NCGR_PEP_ID=MMETSP0370-20130417/144150_1 /TAXON_ID=268820 /ORGANISM="Peridinium aciculiferum, Strain PAER-2" /LENGTH=57 /DNA_ID=CAMNT_0025655859 /DNA_START=193 /DNA_END=364 /DNA_ORIENTATION=+
MRTSTCVGVRPLVPEPFNLYVNLKDDRESASASEHLAQTLPHYKRSNANDENNPSPD